MYEVDDAMLRHLDVLEDYPSFYQRELRPVQMSGGSVANCLVYLLKMFRPELLKAEMLSDYRSSGAHGRPYGERYLRDPSYDYKSDVLVRDVLY